MRADLPIPYTPAMSRALLEGRKTQTRRILSPANLRIWTGSLDTPGRNVKPSPELFAIATEDAADFRMIDGVLTWTAKARDYQAPAERTRWQGRLTYEHGMKLWVREAWRSWRWNDGLKPSAMPAIWAEQPGGYVQFEADGESRMDGKFRPGMYLPRWASRLTLIVTDVRVQRLQDISEEDALAEGVIDMGRMDGEPWSHCYVPGVTHGYEAEPSTCYSLLWEHINGDGSWAANPWVAAYTFTVHQQNIDAMEKANAA